MSTNSRSPAEIEREIEQERAQLASSFEALQERFSIEGITRQVTEQVTRHGGEFGQSALRSAKANPVALALTGIGLAWMMMSDARRNHGDASSSHAVQGTGTTPGAGAAFDGSRQWHHAASGGHGARASAAELRNRLHHGTEHLSESARSRVVAAREAAYQAQLKMERAAGYGRKEIVDFYNEQPIVAGALALALGAALGAALPRTHAEDSTLGGSSDHLFEEAERIFREEVDKAGKAVKSAASSAEAGSGQEGSKAKNEKPGKRPAIGRES